MSPCAFPPSPSRYLSACLYPHLLAQSLSPRQHVTHPPQPLKYTRSSLNHLRAGLQPSPTSWTGIPSLRSHHNWVYFLSTGQIHLLEYLGGKAPGLLLSLVSQLLNVFPYQSPGAPKLTPTPALRSPRRRSQGVAAPGQGGQGREEGGAETSGPSREGGWRRQLLPPRLSLSAGFTWIGRFICNKAQGLGLQRAGKRGRRPVFTVPGCSSTDPA